MLPPNGRHPGGNQSPRRAASTDPGAAAMLVPYAGRVAVATALNAAIARRIAGGQPWKEGQP